MMTHTAQHFLRKYKQKLESQHEGDSHKKGNKPSCKSLAWNRSNLIKTNDSRTQLNVQIVRIAPSDFANKYCTLCARQSQANACNRTCTLTHFHRHNVIKTNTHSTLNIVWICLNHLTEYSEGSNNSNNKKRREERSNKEKSEHTYMCVRDRSE